MRRVLIFSGFYLPGFKGGGPIRTISNMIEVVGDSIECRVVSADRDLGDKLMYSSIRLNEWNPQGKAKVFYVPPSLHGVVRLIRLMSEEKYDAILLNSFFSFKFSILPLLFCRIFRGSLPLVLGPRGEFSSNALGLKRVKKNFFLQISKFLGLHKSVLWLASSTYEEADIRRTIGDDACVRIAMDIAKPGDEVFSASRVPKAPLRLVFLSRISPKKNLLGAIEVLRGAAADIVFDIYGPIEDSVYWGMCVAAAESLPKNVQFRHCGTLAPDEVIATLSKYDLFFFPTLGENFGHVIAEALSAGLPVLVSDKTPWRNLAEKSIGWDVPLERAEEFLVNIDWCFKKSPQEYEDWRKKIRLWAVENIGGKEAVEQNRQLFKNLGLQ